MLTWIGIRRKPRRSLRVIFLAALTFFEVMPVRYLIETRTSRRAPISTKRVKKRFQFSLRDLALVTAGTSVLICALSWAARASGVEHPMLFYILFSLPILTGMGGLLIGRFRGGVIGAFLGAIVLAIVLQFVQ